LPAFAAGLFPGAGLGALALAPALPPFFAGVTFLGAGLGLVSGTVISAVMFPPVDISAVILPPVDISAEIFSGVITAVADFSVSSSMASGSEGSAGLTASFTGVFFSLGFVFFRGGCFWGSC